MFTWAELARKIAAMSDEQRNTDVTVHCTASDEVFVAKSLLVANDECGVLDDGHPYLTIPY